MLVKEILNIELHMSSDFGRINYNILTTVPILIRAFLYIISTLLHKPNLAKDQIQASLFPTPTARTSRKISGFAPSGFFFIILFSVTSIVI